MANCRRKDIVFIKSNLNVVIKNESDQLLEDEAKSQSFIVAKLNDGESEQEIEEKRADKIEKLIQENKPKIVKRVVKK